MQFKKDKLCSVEHGVCPILLHRPHNNFIVRCRIPNFCYHGNKGQSIVNFSAIVKLSALKDPLVGARFCTTIHNFNGQWWSALDAAGETLRFQGTPFEKHCLSLLVQILPHRIRNRTTTMTLVTVVGCSTDLPIVTLTKDQSAMSQNWTQWCPSEETSILST